MLIALAVVAVCCFSWIKYSRYNRIKDVQSGLYMLTFAIDANGVEIEILSNTDPITQVRIEVCNELQKHKALFSEIVKLDSGLEKTIILQRGVVDQSVIETSGTKSIISLPKTIDGSNYSLDWSRRTGHRVWVAPGVGLNVWQFENDKQESYVLFVSVQ